MLKSLQPLAYREALPGRLWEDTKLTELSLSRDAAERLAKIDKDNKSMRRCCNAFFALLKGFLSSPWNRSVLISDGSCQINHRFASLLCIALLMYISSRWRRWRIFQPGGCKGGSEDAHRVNARRRRPPGAQLHWWVGVQLMALSYPRSRNHEAKDVFVSLEGDMGQISLSSSRCQATGAWYIQQQCNEPLIRYGLTISSPTPLMLQDLSE